MFVQENTLEGIRSYFHRSLTDQFSDSEIKLMLKVFVMKRMNLSDTDYLLAQDVRFSESDLLYFRSCVKRLQANEPFQYLVGSTEFYGLELLSDKRALIPRPETEELVDWIVESLERKESLNIIDICAGSGCIALALKSVLQDAKVEAWELSDDALALIKDNVKYTNLEIHPLKMDALSQSYPAPNDHYEVIVSNPPYIPNSDRARMHANVLEFEPEMALFVEDGDPFIFYRRIAEEAMNLLKDKGYLYFEIHEDYGDEMIELLSSCGFVNIELRKDLQGRSRMIRGQRVSSRHEQE